MKIIVDAMGGDNAPEEIVRGVIEAKAELNIDITLVGNKSQIEKILVNQKVNINDYEIVNADEVIINNESPTMAIRRKKNSSLVIGMNLLKQGDGDAFISAGSTGAVLAGGLFILGRIKGIDRPALAPILPGKNGPFLLIDAGANAECKVKNILQFAIMGSIYTNNALKIKNPSVGLVNIGSEEEKGTEFTKQCYEHLKQMNLNFTGNIEGREIPKGITNVVLCDGFTGNLILKMYEGVAETIFDILKEEIISTTRGKIGGLLLKPVFKKFKKEFDYTEHGGAILLGVNKTVIKAHGSSNAKAIKNAVRQAMECVSNDVVGKIDKEIEKNSFD